VAANTQPNKSLQLSRDCVSFIKSLFSQVVAISHGHLNSDVGLLHDHRVENLDAV